MLEVLFEELLGRDSSIKKLRPHFEFETDASHISPIRVMVAVNSTFNIAILIAANEGIRQLGCSGFAPDCDDSMVAQDPALVTRFRPVAFFMTDYRCLCGQ